MQHLYVARESGAHGLIVGAQTIPVRDGVVRPRLKSAKGCRGFGHGEVFELTLKFGVNIHGSLIVRVHSVILDSPEKMRADAVRMM